MIKKYLKNRIHPEDMEIKTFEVLEFVTDEHGYKYPVVVPDKVDMSIYGEFNDWSLDKMKEVGIDPRGFSSPSVAQSRLEASTKISGIDLSSLDEVTND